MHIVSNIRNLEELFRGFPQLRDPSLSASAYAQSFAADGVLAHHHDLILGQVVQQGATSTEDSEGQQRELVLNEWILVPLVERDSSFSHSSTLSASGVPVGAVVDYICRGGGVGFCEDNPPGKGHPTKVIVKGILQYDDGRIASARDFAIDLEESNTIRPMIAVIGSKSDCGKTTACSDLIQLLLQHGRRKIGVAKLTGTARRGELMEMTSAANECLDMADAGLPTTYPPSQCGEESAARATLHVVAAAVKIAKGLSVENDIIVTEFGGDLLAACVPEILAQRDQLNIVAVVMVADSATAVIGMETKLDRISAQYKSIPKYVVGPVANLLANKRRVLRETDCTGCYDLWSRSSPLASPKKVQASESDTQALVQELLEDCGLSKASAAGTP